MFCVTDTVLQWAEPCQHPICANLKEVPGPGLDLLQFHSVWPHGVRQQMKDFLLVPLCIFAF